MSSPDLPRGRSHSILRVVSCAGIDISVMIKDGRIIDHDGDGFHQLSEKPPRARMHLAGNLNNAL
jgi:hypothetical protein